MVFLDFADGLLSNHGRHFGVEGPAWNEVLHGHGVVACTQAMLQVKLMRRFYSVHVELDTQARCRRDINHAAFDLQWFLREVLTILPNPMGIDGRDFARCCGRAMREHGQ